MLQNLIFSENVDSLTPKSDQRQIIPNSNTVIYIGH